MEMPKLWDRKYRRGIARIQLQGRIVPYVSGPFPVGLSADRIRDLLERAAENERIRAVLLDVNSPGGAIVASREMRAAVEAFPKPIVAWIRDVGASGAYLASLGADRIVADRFSMVGSIGVLLPHVEVSELLEKVGVRSDVLKAGQYKDLGLPTRPMTEDERTILQERLDEAHDGFVDEVREARKLDEETAEEVRSGLTFFGERARDLGLVDEVGGLDDALRLCEEMGGFEHDELVLLQPQAEGGFLRRLIGLPGRWPGAVARGLVSAVREELGRALTPR